MVRYSIAEAHPSSFKVAASEGSDGQTEPLLTEQVTGVASDDHQGLIEQINDGLSVDALDVMQESMQVAQRALGEVLGIPATTLGRRKQGGQTLTQPESDRVVRLTRLWDLAVALMGHDQKRAQSWWQTPLAILGDNSPMEHAKTTVGARDVEDLIGRLRHGVVS